MESEPQFLSLDDYIESVKATKGSHFQFKSEKEWESSNVPVTSKFALNLKNLAEDLSTIPFYERQQLPKDLFSEEELTAMDKEAQTCYEQRKQSISEPTPRTEKINPEVPSASTSIAEVQSEIKSLEIDESNKKTDDLEDWLDSVLDS